MCAPCQYRSLPRGTLCTFFGKHDFAAFSGGPVIPGLPDDPDSKSIPIGSDPSKSVLELFQQSCPAIEGEATQSAQNLTSLGIQCGQAPFFGKVPSVAFLMQRYKGMWQFFHTRLPARIRPRIFKTGNQVRFSHICDSHRNLSNYRDYRT